MKAKAAACVLACALGSTALAGCLGAPSATMTEEQASNRQFMAQVNQTMVDFQDRIDGFNDAVSAGDLVGMRTQADNAFRVLDALEKLEAPDALADVKQGYVDGCAAIEAGSQRLRRPVRRHRGRDRGESLRLGHLRRPHCRSEAGL